MRLRHAAGKLPRLLPYTQAIRVAIAGLTTPASRLSAGKPSASSTDSGSPKGQHTPTTAHHAARPESAVQAAIPPACMRAPGFPSPTPCAILPDLLSGNALQEAGRISSRFSAMKGGRPLLHAKEERDGGMQFPPTHSPNGGSGWMRQTRLKISVPFVPPNPKLFFMATSIRRSRAVLAQ